MPSLERFALAVTELESLGLNWMAYARASDGPPDAAVGAHQGVLLFLGMGESFGAQTDYALSQRDPFDERASSLVRPFVSDHLAPWDPKTQLVYPSTTASVNLMAWLAASRAQYPSRLGIGIRPDCGTWFAVRAAVVTDLPAPAEAWLGARYPALDLTAKSPCATCADTPCVSACPAAAVEDAFHLQRCVDQRVRNASPCSARCAARVACPVGSSFRYSEPLQNYHYGVSLNMIRRWVNGES